MSLKAGKKEDNIIRFSDFTGGVNLNDPSISLRSNQAYDAINAKFLARGFDRWPGAQNLTAQAAINDYLRGVFHSSEISGTQHLFEMHGGKLYEVNKSTGALSAALYNLTGQGEAWGCSSHGTFFVANGTAVIKVEGSTAYRVGIAPPTGVTATGATSGGNLPDGVYKLYAAYARRVSSLDVLYSQGQSITDVTITGGGGAGKIAIASFANSADGQVGNKVIFMTLADGSTYYLYKSTGNNTTTSFDITSATPESTSITYEAYAKYNALPGAFTFLFAFKNRLWGIIGNEIFYSMKGATKYDLEIFPALNKITYPYQLTGAFDCGGHLCLNTANNGIIVQPYGDVTAQFEQYEFQTSFKYMRTVADWNGDKIGVTSDRVGKFSAATLKFEPWDYGYNIRPVLLNIWGNESANHIPCGVIYRRGNRIEYQLSVRNTGVNAVNNNRTYILNLSRTMILSIDEYKTPWEVLGRGYNYAAVDASNTLFMGQSFNESSTIYTELSTHSTEVGIYKDAGTYVATATNMTIYVLSKTVMENLFTKTIIENIRALFKSTYVSSILVTIEDDPAKLITQETTASAFGQNNWDEMEWADDAGTVGDNWSAENIRQYEFKGDWGVHGYTWNFKFLQTADDINLYIAEFDVLYTLETGRGI